MRIVKTAAYLMLPQVWVAFFLIIPNVMMLMVYRRQKREISHLYANPATGSNLVLVRSVVISSIVNAAFNI